MILSRQDEQAATNGRSGRPDVMMFGLRNVIGAQGGIENHVRHLAEHLAEQGLNVEILIRSPYSNGGPRRIADGIVLTEIWSPRSVALETAVHSILSVGYAIIKRPHMLHIHAIGPGLMTPIARLFGVRVVVTHHGQDYNREKWGVFAKSVLRLGEKMVACFANECIVVSRPLAADLSKRYARNFEFIPNGVRPITPDKSPFVFGDFHLEPGKYILHVGRIVAEKRQMDLIRAFLELDRPDLKLVFVGAADHHSDYAQKLEALAKSDSRIIFTGFQQGRALSELFANAALFALPSSHEGLPIVVLEAMSYGLPVLISDIPANLALDLPPECYAKTGSIEAWVNGVKRQLDGNRPRNPVDWSQYLLPYKWTDVTRKTIAIYNRIMQKQWPEKPFA